LFEDSFEIAAQEEKDIFLSVSLFYHPSDDLRVGLPPEILHVPQDLPKSLVANANYLGPLLDLDVVPVPILWPELPQPSAGGVLVTVFIVVFHQFSLGVDFFSLKIAPTLDNPFDVRYLLHSAHDFLGHLSYHYAVRVATCQDILSQKGTKMNEGRNNGYLRIKEVAERLRCSSGTVRNMVRDGRLTAYNPTNTWLVSAEEVEKLLQSTKIPK